MSVTLHEQRNPQITELFLRGVESKTIGTDVLNGEGFDGGDVVCGAAVDKEAAKFDAFLRLLSETRRRSTTATSTGRL